ncbi:MAG TPA: hypothetical protein VI408_08235 [Gaiellaceae bacterium]
MKRLVLVLAAAALLLPGAARSAACSPLACGPNQFLLAHGTLLAYRHSVGAPISVADLGSGESLFTLPRGLVYGDVLVRSVGRRIDWFDATTGKRTASTTLPWRFRLAGASQDGSRAVAFHGTDVVIATPHAWRQVPLPSARWDFDALRGRNLVLIRYLANGYQVERVDLAGDTTPLRALKGVIWGQPWSRLSSADGRYLFTLYLAANGAAMVHELDLQNATARCIDLPGTGDYGSGTSWALALAPDRRTLWAVSPGYGRVVAIDIATRKVVDHFRISLPYWNLGTATRIAVSPDGTEAALTDGETVARVSLHLRRVASRTSRRAVAVGYSPTTGELRTLP